MLDPTSPQTTLNSEGPAARKLLMLAIGLWCVLGVAVAVKAAVVPRTHTTFPCFAAGSNCWWAEIDMYDVAKVGYEYRYSPTFAVLFSPFARLPERVGGLLWGLMNVSVLFGTLQILRNHVLPSSWTTRQHAWFLLLTFLGTASALWNGQTNTLIFSLITGGAAAVIRRNWWLAAALLAAPAFIKVWPIAAALLFVACWPRQLLLRFLVTCGGLALLPFLTKPHGVVLQQYQSWLDALTGPMQVRHVYRDAWTLWETLYPPVNPTVFAGLKLGSAALVLALCWWHRWRSVSDRRTAMFIIGLWAAWQLLFGPGSERTTVCIIAPILSWGLVVSLEQGRPRGGSRWLLAAFVLTTLFTFGDFERLLIAYVPSIYAAIPVGVLMFSVWYVNHARLENGHEIDIAPKVSRGYIPAAIRSGQNRQLSSR